MGRFGRVGVVIAGYVLAIAAAAVAAWLYDVRVGALPYDTSGGMYAGGQMLQSLAVFLMVALAPSLYGLWLLRRHTTFWNGVALASIAFAALGLIAVLSTRAYSAASPNVALLLLSLLGLAQLLGVPLWSAAFALFAWLAPTREARRKLIIAVGIELVIAVCAAVHWFVPNSPI